MKDPSEIRTKNDTPLIVFITRLLFIGYFITAVVVLEQDLFPNSTFSYIWLFYLIFIYYVSERIYAFYEKKDIDLSFAFPLLYAVYIFNLGSMLVAAQEKFPIINRAEHFLSFILITYVIWVFFLKYLPQQVWGEHPYYTALLVMSVTSTLGVVNELVELFSDELFNTVFIGNRLDTPLDLLMNSLGIFLFLGARLILGPSPAEQAEVAVT